MTAPVIAFGADGSQFLAHYVGEAIDPYTGRRSLIYRGIDGRERAAVGHGEVPTKVAILQPRPARQDNQPKGAA